MIDEPDQPAASWGSLTYADIAARARAQAAGLDALGIAVGERVAIVSHNSARLLTSFFGVSGSGRVLVPINFRLVAEEVAYIIEHSGARVLLVDPELDDALKSVDCERRYVIGSRRRRRTAPVRRRAGAVGAGRGRHGDDQLHERHDRPPEGRAADPPHGLDQRHHLRLADGRQRRRRVPPHPAPVPLQRLGHGVRGHRHGRHARRAAQGRRGRDPAPRRAPRRDVDVRGTGRRQRDRRCGSGVGGRDPRSRPGADGARRCTAADQDDRADRDRARVGVRPDLRPDRDRPAADDEPPPQGDRLAVAAPSGRRS